MNVGLSAYTDNATNYSSKTLQSTSISTIPSKHDATSLTIFYDKPLHLNVKDNISTEQEGDHYVGDEDQSFKFTRKSLTAPTEERSLHLEECFICEKQALRSELREAMTMQLNTRLHQCAQNLQDQYLLAGDVVAQELTYHRACLTSLYNKERAHLRMKSIRLFLRS